MSVRVMSDVFQRSKARGVDRLVLLAIADSANDHGCEAWPSFGTLALKAGVSRRTVVRSVGRLIEMGELERVRKGGLSARGGVSNSYRVTVSSPQKQGQAVPRDGEALVPTGPEVGTESPSSGDEVAPNPSLTILNHPRSDAPPVDNQPAVVSIAAARSALGKTDPTARPTGEEDAG